MSRIQFLKFSQRPSGLPKDAPRVWPLIEVISVAGLVAKPIILALIAIGWWTSLTFGLSPIASAVLASALGAATLIVSIPTLVRVYWDAQLLTIEERSAARRPAPTIEDAAKA